MQIFKFHRDYLSQISKQQLNLVYNQDAYLPFLNHTYSAPNFNKQLTDKSSSFRQETRNILVEALQRQYEKVAENELTMLNIDLLLDENTFTITTGHQLSVFTGPLYFVLKILHAIKQCEELKKIHPKNKFVPVYWMATEDHDFEEIQSLNLFTKKITWEASQKGPVGRFNLDGFTDFKNEIKQMFSNHPNGEIHQLIDAYQGDNLTEATRNLVHLLFKKYGLIIIDGDDAKLKKIFSPTVKKELTEQFSFHLVTKTNKELINVGYKIQVNPREINLFYIKDGLRERIILENGKYSVSGIAKFTKEEILIELEKFPERFSPNVILRPLYQEMILPNLCYIGGGGEVSYWLQLKAVFDAVDCVFPLVGVRNSVIWIELAIAKKKEKIALLLEDIFKTKDQLKKEYVQNNSDEALHFKNVDGIIEELKLEITDLIAGVDSSMVGYSSAENVKLQKQIEGIKSKLIKISKSKHESAMKTIDQIIDKLFPNGGLQERTTNFFSFCPDGNYADKLDALYDCISPEEKDLLILEES